MSEFPGVEEVLLFWFGPLEEDGAVGEAARRRWFSKDPDFDDELRQRFGGLHAELGGNSEHPWRSQVRSNLAYIIVLDQMSRNMYRDTPNMYATDALARDATLVAVERGDDLQLTTAEVVFLFMPLMHSERLLDQERCVELFSKLRERVPASQRSNIENSLDYAKRHRDIVKKWGRFPHRNEILGRESTPEELAFLKEPGSSF